MIGGDPGVFESGKPYFECVGKQFRRCDGPGLGLHAKLTNNLILSNIMQAFTEGRFLNTKAGVDPDLVLGILDNSAARTGWITFKILFVFSNKASTSSSCMWMHGDTCLALDSG